MAVMIVAAGACLYGDELERSLLGSPATELALYRSLLVQHSDEVS
jgi:hypothetical protein